MARFDGVVWAEMLLDGTVGRVVHALGIGGTKRWRDDFFQSFERIDSLFAAELRPGAQAVGTEEVQTLG